MAMGHLRRHIISEYLSALRTHSRWQSFCGDHFYIFMTFARQFLVAGHYSPLSNTKNAIFGHGRHRRRAPRPPSCTHAASLTPEDSLKPSAPAKPSKSSTPRLCRIVEILEARMPLYHSAPRVRGVPQTPSHRFFLPWQYFCNRAPACPHPPFSAPPPLPRVSIVRVCVPAHTTLTDRRYLLAEKGGISTQESPSPCWRNAAACDITARYFSGFLPVDPSSVVGTLATLALSTGPS